MLYLWCSKDFSTQIFGVQGLERGSKLGCVVFAQTFSVLVCMKNGCLCLQSVHLDDKNRFKTIGSTRTELGDAAPQAQETSHRTGTGDPC